MSKQTDREKLIKLCDTNNGWVDEVPAEKFADYLLSHGVTFEKQGEWEISIGDYGGAIISCSLCESSFYDEDSDVIDHIWNYCPNCGAKMNKNKNP